MKFVLYWTDALVYLLVIGLILWLITFRKTNEWRLIQNCIFKKTRYLIVLMILAVYGLIGVLDTIHFKNSHHPNGVKSVLDLILSPLGSRTEITYSAPFALYSYSSETFKTNDGQLKQIFPRLKYSGVHLKYTDQDRRIDILLRMTIGVFIGLGLTVLFYCAAVFFNKVSFTAYSPVKKTFWLTLGCILIIISSIAMLMHEYHILGTDKVGRDVFYIAVKSIRTGLVIGTVTTLVMLPFALLFGMWSGYYRGWVDDIIQYIYTTLSSVPGILLIAAAVLSFQIRVEENPDLRLVILCIILGVTSWTTLCRLLRGETLKLRESGFVESAIVLGTKNFKILWHHIMPNLMHIVIITVVLDFSSLVLAEAVLSYVGVGVDPTSYSWGNMINAARLEMARDPVVWWSLLGALFLMFTLVFSANVFSDALQEALNPREA